MEGVVSGSGATSVCGQRWADLGLGALMLDIGGSQ